MTAGWRPQGRSISDLVPLGLQRFSAVTGTLISHACWGLSVYNQLQIKVLQKRGIKAARLVDSRRSKWKQSGGVVYC